MISRAIAVDQFGKAYITGHTLSAQFPTRDALQENPGAVSCHAIGGGSFPLDAFVAGFDALGTLEFSTYLGGDGNDIGLDIALDTQSNLYIVGETSSADFPLVGPVREVYQGGAAQPVGTCNGDEGFVAKLNAERTALTYSAYFLGQAVLGDSESSGHGVLGAGSGVCAGSESCGPYLFALQYGCLLRDFREPSRASASGG